MTDPIGIEIRNLYKIFGARPGDYVEAVRAGMTKAELQREHRHVLGLSDINISIAPGSIQVIMGLSGSGKSTLIRHINRLIEPTAGEIIIEDRNVVDMSKDDLRDFRRHKTAMVFQKFGLLPHRTVRDNVALPLEIQCASRQKRFDIAEEALAKVNLAGWGDRYCHELSGGMQQRVSIARALIHDPKLILMDEPFGALDAITREKMNFELLRIWAEAKKTVLFVTHEISEAVFLSDRIVVLSARPSQMVGNVSVELPRPRSLEMKMTPDFNAYTLQIYNMLEK